MVIGRTPSSSSIVAILIGSTLFSGMGIRTGAPIAICRALAPTILDFSYLVNLGSHILTSLALIRLDLFFEGVEGAAKPQSFQRKLREVFKG